MTEHSLRWFNDLPDKELRAALRACNVADRFVDEMAAGRPYDTAAEVAQRAEQISRSLDWAQVCTALSDHPRIGERAAGDTAEARSSRTEQVAMDDADREIRARLIEGNRDYEARFGHVYLIRAAGRTPVEVLAELSRRLDNDEAAERAEVTGQLAEISRLRVEKLVES